MTKPDDIPTTASSFASRRAAREAHEAEHGPAPASRRHALSAGDNADDASRVVISRVQA